MCGASFERPDLLEIPDSAPCPTCTASVEVALVCKACDSVYPLSAFLSPAGAGRCAQCGASVPSDAALCPECGAEIMGVLPPVPKPRAKRRLLGEYPPESVDRLVRALGIRRAHAEALCTAGFDTVDRVKAATPDDLGRIPGVGSRGAFQIATAAIRAPEFPSGAREAPDPREECECPVCGCPTSLWRERCLDCGLPFAAEPVPAGTREEIERLRIGRLSGFFNGRILGRTDDALLWYARSLALQEEGHPREALASAEVAVNRAPGLRRAQVLRFRLLADLGPPARLAEVAQNLLESFRPPMDFLEKALEEDAALTALAELDERACPHCGGEVLSGAAVCPACGSSLSEIPPQEPEVAKAIDALEDQLRSLSVPVPPAPDAPRELQAPETTAMRRGLGEVNGLVNGQGRINGLLDHRGFINGSTVREARLPVRQLLPRYVAVAASLLLLFTTANLAFGPFEAGTGITVDASFGDWSAQGVVPFRAVHAASQPSLSLSAFAVHRVASHLYLWVEAEGRLLSDPTGLDTVYAFLDADGNPDTGYRILGLGADFRVGVIGGNSTVESSVLHDFEGADAEDWTGWMSLGPVGSAVAGRSLEIDVPLGPVGALSPDYLVAFLVEGNDGDWSASAVAVGDSPAAIRASLSRETTVVTVGTQFASLALSLAGGTEARVDDVLLDVLGPAGVQVQGLPLLLTSGSPAASLDLVVTSTTGAQPGDVVTVRVASVAATAPVTVEAGVAAAYLISPSTAKRVDGLFADWANDTAPSGGATPSNPDVDLEGQGASDEGGAFFVYAEVLGEALRGGRVPQVDQRTAPSTGQSGPAQSAGPPARRTAEDRLLVLVDVDPGGGTGARYDGIEPDWRVEVRGRGGKATASRAYSWGAGGWGEQAVPVAVAAFGSEVELRLGVPVGPDALVVIDLRDWQGAVDATMAFGTRGGTRGGTTPQPTASDPPSWPTSWNSLATDPDEGVSDTTLEILEVRAGESTEYLYFRLIVEGSPPVLTDNTWWVYLDLTADGDNDWVIEERPVGSGEVCSFAWGGSSWGTGSPGCDISESIGDSDVGSSVRVVGSCSGSNGCVDFALEKSDYSGLGATPKVTAADDATEDLSLEGNTNRNPTDTGGGACDDVNFDDCTAPLSVPEFTDLLVALAPALLVPLFLRRRRHC